MCDVVESANYYEFEHTELPVTPTSVWMQKTSTKRKLEKEGLTSGQQYAFRMAAAGSDPSRVYSEIVISFIL